MSPTIIIYAVLCIAVVIVATIYDLRRARAKRVKPTTTEKADGHPMYGCRIPTETEWDGVLGVLLSAHRSLRRQRAARYRSWISSCIERLQMGEEVSVETALQALYRTKGELSEPRYVKDGEPTIYFNLDGLNDAIVTLEKQLVDED